MKKAIAKFRDTFYILYLHPNATIEDFRYKFCEHSGLKYDNPILQFLTIDGNIPSKDTKIFEMYFEEDLLIRIPNRVEYGDFVVEETPPIEMPYMIYVVLNHAVSLIFVPYYATIADMKKYIVYVTGIPPAHPSLKSLKINGCQFENTCSLFEINFENPTVLYLEDINTELPQEEENLQYNFFVVWNNRLVTVSVDKMSSMAVLISKIIKATGIPPNHPSLKNISIEGNTPDMDTVLSSLYLNKNSAILLRNIKLHKSEVKTISLLIHFNLKLYIIILCNTNTIEKLIMEASKATSLTNSHPLLQNMTINGYHLKNFIFISDLELSMETHVYLENTPVYFTSDHPLTSEPYIYITIIFDKTYEIVVPDYITIGLLKQAIISFTEMGTANKCLENLNIEGFLAVNDSLLLSEFTSKKAVTINLNETKLNFTSSSHTFKAPIEFTIISKTKPFRIIMGRDKTIQNLIKEMHRISEVSPLIPEGNSLMINGVVKYGNELLSTIPNDFVTISLVTPITKAETSTTQVEISTQVDSVPSSTKLQTPACIKKICIIHRKLQYVTSVYEDRPLRYLLRYMMRILNVPANHSFFKNLVIDGKQASVHSIISDLNLKNYTILDLDAVENVTEKQYAITFTTKKMYYINKKIEAIVKTYQAMQLHNLDPEKKLLVLDLDQTLIDYPKDGIIHAGVLRPHLHTFLTMMYKYYNLIVWSATDWRVILNKIQILSLDKHQDFKFAVFIDQKAMIPVNISYNKLTRAKPLMVIWNLFEQFNAKNTIMLDDISTNFILNPHNGIVVKAYVSQNCTTDNELEKLQNYLKNIALISNDFTQIKLQNWETSDLR